MTNTDLKRAMIQHCNGAMFITCSELAKFLGYSDQSAKSVKSKYLIGLESVDKKYFIPDVAGRIMERRG